MAEIGSVIDGKYEILKLIGKGGMSRVYLAMDKRLNKQWAVKEIQKRAHDKNNEVVIQSAIAEANMIKSLDHPSLPRIVDIIEQQDVIYVIMDYIEGETLNNLVKQGAQPQEAVIDWGMQLCGVLDYLHTRRPAIIYRDMKPGNVMLKPDGTVKLIDFGIAREYKEHNLSDTVSLGTKGYAAPEQFGGNGQTDPRTDIYCLGVTLHHLVTGHSPTDPPYEIYPIRQYDPELSAGLEEIIQKCIQPNPSDRYQSCAELLYALAHFEDGDRLHKQILKKKMRKFYCVVGACVCCLAAGITGQIMNHRTTNADYVAVLAKAEKVSAKSEKIDFYSDAISIKPTTMTAYEELVETLREDTEFTVEEENILKTAINDHLIDLRSSPGYAQLAFHIGKLYWYYYTYGTNETTDDNQLTRMKSSIQWFQDAVDYGKKTDDFYDMATIYCEIGRFNKDITINIQEAKDKGEYKEYWDNLCNMMEWEQDSNDEIVVLELDRLVINAVENYARKFKSDGISQSEQLELYQKAKSSTQKVATTTDKTDAMKKQITGRFDATESAIENAYVNANGQN